MLSQQQRDADGRATQSGINAHCRALHTRGREEKHHQSKRGRSLADNEKPCYVSSTGNQMKRGRKTGGDGEKQERESFRRTDNEGMNALDYCKAFMVEDKIKPKGPLLNNDTAFSSLFYPPLHK